MHFTQIKETCLYSSNLVRAEEFYNQILGLEIIGKTAGRHVFFKAGTSVLLIFNPEATSIETFVPPHDGYGRIHFAFEVSKEDYDNAKKELISKNVSIIHEHTWKYGRSFYFHDPDGHVLEILEGNAIWD